MFYYKFINLYIVCVCVLIQLLCCNFVRIQKENLSNKVIFIFKDKIKIQYYLPLYNQILMVQRACVCLSASERECVCMCVCARACAYVCVLVIRVIYVMMYT